MGIFAGVFWVFGGNFGGCLRGRIFGVFRDFRGRFFVFLAGILGGIFWVF